MNTKMLRLALAPAAVVAAVAGSAHAQEVTIYKQPNYAGGQLTLKNDSSNLSGSGFKNQIGSMVVKSGRWQACSQPDFKGDCTILERGEYPTLDQAFTNRIESMREVTQTAERGRYGDERYASRDSNDRYERRRYADDRSYGRGASVELFTAPGFRGRTLRLDGDENNLDDRLDRGISSLVVREGRWQLCTQPGYRGKCEVYEPGRYDDLGRLGLKISSARRVG